MTKPRRRQAGEGSISEYATKAGPRFRMKCWAPQPDGTRKQVLRRGFLTRKAAAEGLREQLADVDRGTHVAPSRMTVERHFDTWLDGLRKGPTTVASYRKNVRLHVVPYIGDVKLAASPARGLPPCTDSWRRPAARTALAASVLARCATSTRSSRVHWPPRSTTTSSPSTPPRRRSRPQRSSEEP